MNAQSVVDSNSSSGREDAAADAEMSLAALFDLLSTDDPEPASAHRSLRGTGTRLLTWLQESARRAARWDALSREPALRVNRPSSTVIGEVK